MNFMIHFQSTYNILLVAIDLYLIWPLWYATSICTYVSICFQTDKYQILFVKSFHHILRDISSILHK